MNKNVATTAVTVIAALAVMAVFKAVLPDIRRYVRISRM